MSDKLSWSHICELIKIDDELERNFYEKECVVENWNVRTLRRQMDSALFLRLASSRDKEGIIKLAQNGIECQSPEDIVKSTYISVALLLLLTILQPHRWKVFVGIGQRIYIR